MIERRRASSGALRSRSGGAARVWMLTGVLAGVTAIVHFASRSMSQLNPPFRIPWWILAALFLLAEMNVIYVQVRRDGFMFSLSEVPLVLGLFFTDVDGLVLAQVIGAGVALAAWRRQPPVKLFFNLSHLALEATLAFAIMRAIGGMDPLGPIGWAAAGAAVIITSLLADVVVWFAIGLADGSLKLSTIKEGFGFGKVTVLTNTALGLGAAVLLWLNPAAAWLQLVPAATVVVAYRAYTIQRRRHEGLEALYDSFRAVQRSVQFDSMVRELLARVREMFRAEIAEIVFFPPAEDGEATTLSLGPGDDISETRGRLDPTQGVWARVAAEDRALLLARPIQNVRLREFFEGRGMRDLMVVPLHSDTRVVGVLQVANRLGDISTFDDDDLRLIDTLASHASVALENARLISRLEESLAHLSQVNQMKDDFISTVSHELRTPLTVMQGSVKTMLREDVHLGPDQERTFLEAAERSGERLQQLIEQLLMVSRLEAGGGGEMERGPVSIASLLSRVTEELEPRREGHRLESDLEKGLPIVVTDGPKLHQILSNILENALKYSPPGSTIRAKGWRDRDGIVLAVVDQGVGIPADHQERIFDRFYQVDSSSTRTVGGTGLGLYICRRLAEELGGRLWLETSSPAGSEFRLAVPLQPSEQVPDEVRTEVGDPLRQVVRDAIGG